MTGNGKSLDVLFLDDEESILKSIKRTLYSEPFGVAMTTDPAEALDILNKERIKVVFSDQRMPKISGVDFLLRIKEEHPDIIRILFTGYSDIPSMEKAINVSEIHRFINKPWNGDDLVLTVKRALQHYDLVRENRKFFESAKSKNNELENLNEQLVRMNQTLKEFASTVSHELRTPLASIKMAIDLIMRGMIGDLNDQQRDVLDKAKSNVDRLNRLINDLLDLSKMEAGKLKLNTALNELNPIVKDVIEAQSSVAEQKGLFLKTQFEEENIQAIFDSDRIVQVLNNLVNNAIKFTEQGGITVSCVSKHADNTVQICVEDSGKGIATDDMAKLFKKFQQLEDPFNDATGGTGLGLAICREIVTIHGGKIWVESEPGKGSQFYFTLRTKEK